MLEILYEFYFGLHLGLSISAIAAFGTIVTLSIIAGLILQKVTGFLFLDRVEKKVRASKESIADVIVSTQLLNRLLWFVLPALVMSMVPSGALLPQAKDLIEPMYFFVSKACSIYMVILVGVMMDTAFNTIQGIYNLYSISAQWPIKSYIQFLKVFNFIIFIVFVVCDLINQSPLAFFTGLGAAMAIVVLVFKDTILSFVASLQVSASQLLQVGDWIEIPEKDINGHVIEMSLNAIKVQNFDKSISSIPPYYVTTNALKNWRGMFQAGGRRIKRNLNLDTSTIGFASTALQSDLGDKYAFLKDYMAMLPSGGMRELTNLGLFRAYVEHYLINDPRFWSANFTSMVRHMPTPDGAGLPLEIYVFTHATNTKDYEQVQASLFEYLISILADFQLKLYQQQ